MLDSDLEEIHFTLRVTTDVNNLLRAIDKYFGAAVNYGKGGKSKNDQNLYMYRFCTGALWNIMISF